MRSEIMIDAIVYLTKNEVVILGNPAHGDETKLDENDWHNCDEMGCGRSHVIGRYPINKDMKQIRELARRAERTREDIKKGVKEFLKHLDKNSKEVEKWSDSKKRALGVQSRKHTRRAEGDGE